jgi:hypothetical protein
MPPMEGKARDGSIYFGDLKSSTSRDAKEIYNPFYPQHLQILDAQLTGEKLNRAIKLMPIALK